MSTTHNLQFSLLPASIMLPFILTSAGCLSSMIEEQEHSQHNTQLGQHLKGKNRHL
jgi:hypothetical protein